MKLCPDEAVCAARNYDRESAKQLAEWFAFRYPQEAGRNAVEVAIEYLEQSAEEHADALRWRALCAAVEASRPFGAVILCSSAANAHDAAWASVQGIRWDNPTSTLWIHEGETLDAVIDAIAREPVNTVTT